jgi:4-amino-4-deoxy-L-arabinose transferase-like glycosyltransferase
MSRRRGRDQKRAVAPAPRREGWNWRLLLFLAVVFAVKAIVLAQLLHHPLLEAGGGGDSSEYVTLARRVLGGDLLLGPGLYYLSPLYVYFLAALLAISDSFTFVRVVQIALGTAAVGGVYVAARTWFGARAAWIAAGLAALTGVFTFYEIVIFQSSIDVFLTAAGLACLAVGLSRHSGFSHDKDLPPKGGSYLTSSSGIFFGLQFLNRPNIAIAIAGVVVALLVTRRWRAAAWLTAGFAIAVSPVVIRNAVVTHDLALTSSQGGLNFYIGNHANATGQYVAVPGVRANMAGQAEDTRKVAEAAVGHSLTDAQVSSYFRGLGLQWTREHPAAAGALFLRKLALTFNARHQWLDYSYPYYAYDTGSALQWLFVGPWLLVPLGFLGAALLLTGSPGSPGSSGSPGSGFSGFVVLVAFAVFYALSVAVFFVAERYRLPLFVPLAILSGVAVDRLLQAFRKPTSKLQPPTSARAPSAAAIAAGIAGAIVTAWPFVLEDGRYEERLRLSKALMNQRDYGGAAAELERALALRPGDPTTEFHLGMALLSDGRPQEGLDHLRRGVDARVPIPGARYALANAMLMTGDRDGAGALLRTYSPAPEDTAESCLHVAQLAMSAGAPLVAQRYLQRALQLRPGWPEALQLLEQLRR